MRSLNASYQEADFSVNNTLLSVSNQSNTSQQQNPQQQHLLQSLLLDPRKEEFDFDAGCSSSILINSDNNNFKSLAETITTKSTKVAISACEFNTNNININDNNTNVLSENAATTSTATTSTATTSTATTSTATTSTATTSTTTDSATIHHKIYKRNGKRGATDSPASVSISPSKKSKKSTNTIQNKNNVISNKSRRNSSITCNSSSSENGNNSDIGKIPSTSSSTSSKETATTNTKNSTSFNIHDKLRQLYAYLYFKDKHIYQDDRVNLKHRSFLLEKLVEIEKLNTIIINLYPGNKGYSLAFRKNNNAESSNLKKDNLQTYFNTKMKCYDRTGDKDNEGNIEEVMHWPYENDALLECINNEEIPLFIMDVLETRKPNIFYSGCIIAEIRDYRQSFPKTCCDTFFILLKPTNQTIFADVNQIASKCDLTEKDKLNLESQIVLATSEPLCLDPNPDIGRKFINNQFKIQMWNTSSIRRQMKKFSQVSINRKRKTDQFTHVHGLELNNYLRHKPRISDQTSVSNSILTKTLPKEILSKIRPNRILFPLTLSAPKEVIIDKAKFYEKPRDNKECFPQIIETLTLERERSQVKITIFQRPSTSECLGELYATKEYGNNQSNDTKCRFILGTKPNANQYMKQFTDMFTKEGRISVNITHQIGENKPTITTIPGIIPSQEKQPQQYMYQQGQQNYRRSHERKHQQRHNVPAQPQLSRTQHQHQNLPRQYLQRLLAPSPANITTTPTLSPILSTHSTITNFNTQISHNQILQSGGNVLNHNQNYQQHTTSQQQQQHINLTNASMVLLQQQQQDKLSPNNALNNINIPINTCQQEQIQQQSNKRTSLANSTPVLQAQLQAQIQLHQLQHRQMRHQSSVSTNPKINEFATSLMQSANQFQQQKANAAIKSLLNSAPAAMTSSSSQLQQQISQRQHLRQQLNGNSLLTKNKYRDNVGGVIVTNRQQQYISNMRQDKQQTLSQRVTMSALASQLASPPAIMSNATINSQNFNIAQSSNISNTKIGQSDSNNNDNSINKHQLLLNNSNTQLLNQKQQLLRNDSLNLLSPVSVDSNGSRTSSGSSLPSVAPESNLNFIMSGISNLQTDSPPALENNNIVTNPSLLLDRLNNPNSLLHQQLSSQQYMSLSPTTNLIQQQSPLSSSSSLQNHQLGQPHQQTQATTLNINVANFQKSLAIYPGLQNVQVQIQGMSKPISLPYLPNQLVTGTMTSSTSRLQNCTNSSSFLSPSSPSSPLALSSASFSESAEAGQPNVLNSSQSLVNSTKLIAQQCTLSQIKSNNYNNMNINTAPVKLLSKLKKQRKTSASSSPSLPSTSSLTRIKPVNKRDLILSQKILNSKGTSMSYKQLQLSSSSAFIPSGTIGRTVTTPIASHRIPQQLQMRLSQQTQHNQQQQQQNLNQPLSSTSLHQQQQQQQQHHHQHQQYQHQQYQQQQHQQQQHHHQQQIHQSHHQHNHHNHQQQQEQLQHHQQNQHQHNHHQLHHGSSGNYNYTHHNRTLNTTGNGSDNTYNISRSIGNTNNNNNNNNNDSNVYGGVVTTSLTNSNKQRRK